MLDESLELIPEENESMLSSQRTITVNHRNDDEFSVTGYKRNNALTGLFYVLGFLSLGFVFLLSYWYPHKRLKFTHDVCYFENATSLLIVNANGGQCSVKKIKFIKVNSGGIDNKDLVIYEKSFLTHRPVYYFEHMFLRYHFNDQFTDIHELSGLDNLFTSNDIEKMKDGLSSEASKLKVAIHNFNIIDVPLKSYAIVCIELAANPFYCFQLFSVILWYTDEYQYYASVILFLTVISLAITTYDTRKHMKKLHDMVGESTTVSVLRKSHEINRLDSKLLVPGDVFIIPHSGLNVPCDAVLITGRCIVNESSLTGESFPVTKTAVDRLVDTDEAPTIFSFSKNKQHALYNGTKILEAHCLQNDPRNQQVLALVIRTGFTTLKGRLVRSIIHPKPVHFKFFRDSMKFILTFGFIAFLGFIYSLVTFVNHGEDAGYVIRRSLDLFTIAIPPALPACMSIGIMHAMRDLKKYNIYSIDPDRINLCAKIKLFVFDKTGTLTEDRLTVNGVIVNDEKELSQLKTEVGSMKDDAEILKGNH